MMKHFCDLHTPELLIEAVSVDVVKIYALVSSSKYAVIDTELAFVPGQCNLFAIR